MAGFFAFPDGAMRRAMSDAINLVTFGDLLRHGYKLAGWCRPCDRHEDIDLTKLPADRNYVEARFKCRTCGAAVAVTLSQIKTANDAPMPALDRWRSR